MGEKQRKETIDDWSTTNPWKAIVCRSSSLILIGFSVTWSIALFRSSMTLLRSSFYNYSFSFFV
jgi:hypothetical protein